MPVVRAETTRPLLLAGLLLGLTGAASAQGEPHTPPCEYRLLEIEPDSGDLRFVRPQKIGPQDCLDSGAAMAEIDPGWRQRLPPRVRWKQMPDAATLCQAHSTAWGRRTGQLPGEICVFLLAGQSCTVVTAQAVSQAVLANAVRYCVP